MRQPTDWLKTAREHLEHAAHAEEGGFCQWACFSAQQAAEKAVTAVYAARGERAWGPSVSEPLADLANRCAVPDELIQRAVELDKAYEETRDPNRGHPTTPGQRYTRADAGRLRGYAEEIVEFSEGLVAERAA